MDTKNDVAQATAAADPVIDSKPPVGDAAAAPPASPPVAEPHLPPAAGLAAPIAEGPPAPPVETPKPTENIAPGSPPPRREPPIVAPPAGAQRAGPRKEGSSSRTGRFAILAASIALTAGIGGALGAAGFATVSKMMAAPAPTHQRTAAGDEIKAEIKALRDSITQTRASVKTLTDNVAALKAAFESAGKATGGQFAKVSETIARLSESVERAERMQAEPAARLAKVIETLERLERRAAGMGGAPETTGSIAAQQGKQLGQPPQSLQQQQQQLAQPPAPALPPPQIVAEAKASAPAIVEGWVLHRVQGGIALIEGRFGLAEVEAGDTIRGVGRVQEIKRQDGRWVVVTARGLIVPGR